MQMQNNYMSLIYSDENVLVDTVSETWMLAWTLPLVAQSADQGPPRTVPLALSAARGLQQTVPLVAESGDQGPHRFQSMGQKGFLPPVAESVNPAIVRRLCHRWQGPCVGVPVADSATGGRVCVCRCASRGLCHRWQSP